LSFKILIHVDFNLLSFIQFKCIGRPIKVIDSKNIFALISADCLLLITRRLMLAYFQILRADSLVSSHRPTRFPVGQFFNYAKSVSGDIYQNSSCYFFTLSSLELFG